MPINPETLQRLKQSEDEFARKLVKDIRTVFNTMVGVEDLMHLPIQVDLTRDFEDCITALVGMAGTVNGLVSVHVPSGLAKSFTTQMLGMEVEEIDQDVYDALGEIANMIAGSFKQHFSKSGADISVSLPSIVYGYRLQLQYRRVGQREHHPQVCLRRGVVSGRPDY